MVLPSSVSSRGAIALCVTFGGYPIGLCTTTLSLLAMCGSPFSGWLVVMVGYHAWGAGGKLAPRSGSLLRAVAPSPAAARERRDATGDAVRRMRADGLKYGAGAYR